MGRGRRKIDDISIQYPCPVTPRVFNRLPTRDTNIYIVNFQRRDIESDSRIEKRIYPRVSIIKKKNRNVVAGY